MEGGAAIGAEHEGGIAGFNGSRGFVVNQHDFLFRVCLSPGQ
jgi:hypothetical protein